MPISNDIASYTDKELTISLQKDFSPTRQLYCHIVLETDKFAEYQKDLIQDFLSDLVGVMEDEEIMYSEFKKQFEAQFQNLNTKLQVFAEKIKDVERFTLKGVAHAFFDDEYVASMIG